MSIDELADLANMTRSTLKRHFVKTAGKSIKRYQLELKINMAMSIFRNNPDIRVREVSASLGFFDEYHFSRTFKKISGQAPKHFQKAAWETDVTAASRAKGD